MLQNFGVHLLLESHVPGTRQWLFDRVDKWLETALNAGEDARTLNHHRMFLLLAGPGMGKSVFSAVMEKKLEVKMQAGQRLVLVRHFFKVGEPRAQGKAMVLCLALQLAEQLPGMATLLWLVAKEHGSADQLTLKDTFDKYLMEPLTALDKEHSAEQPVVVMLLDAIDEATDGAAGCEPVTHLVGHQMSKLPAWVKIVLTGRPQMESCFQAWEPEWIQPSAHENTEDMHKLLVAWLQQDGKIVSSSDFEAAVEVMLRKSEGQFIWAKFAFDQLRGRVGCWTPAEMEAELPSGLSGMYRHIMEVLQDALREENPDALTLLRQQLLPILVATKSPLTSQQLAVMTGAEQHQVDLLLRLLVNMFPVRLHSGSLKVVPYHKSVLDWLAEDPQFSVDAGQGHECLGKACFAAVVAAKTSPSKLANHSGLETVSSCQTSGSILEYALHFGVTHLCLAHSCVKLLEDLILDFCGLWPMAFAQGCGNGLLKDLIALGPTTSAVVKDVVRWLRLTSSYLSVHPRAALQLACDSPRNSVVAKHANSLPEKPQAKLVTRERHKEFVTSVAMNAGIAVSGSSDTEVRVWDLDSGFCKDTLSGHAKAVTSVAVSSDARICVPGSGDKTLRVWDLDSGFCKNSLSGHTKKVTSVAVCMDARICVSGSSEKTLRVWDLENGACTAILRGHTEEVASVAVCSDARICLSGSGDGTLRVWDLESGTCKATLAGHDDIVTSVAVSSNARTCVSGSWDKTLRVWDKESGTCKATLAGHSHWVTSVAVTPDARTCVSGSSDDTLSHMVTSVAVSSDARTCVSGSCDETLRVWDLVSGFCKDTSLGHTDHVTCVAVSLDAGICVSGSSDKTLRVWDLQSGACKATLSGHTKAVTSVSMSPDARICVSSSLEERSHRKWDVTSGKELDCVFSGGKEGKQLHALAHSWKGGHAVLMWAVA
ncbi:WD40-repeat-containing domain protein [Dunaliella salina]|uniref:WD40-repeat-containing domain protein n=1 Tax=Dunaliella salina TaxID=3046 RepID=A0ABQ7GTV3_DUNSA|nr:WD40-repeat-containing domain protein [Dunaliella salina]|eukprot:KAF5838041.1 WD40-repeat-containing domain protein [Dunaliella salina]